MDGPYMNGLPLSTISPTIIIIAKGVLVPALEQPKTFVSDLQLIGSLHFDVQSAGQAF